MRDDELVRRQRTMLAQCGAEKSYPGGRSVMPAVVRASTVLFKTLEEMEVARSRRMEEKVFTYGAKGNPTCFELEDLIAELEGGYRTRLFPTGLSAIAMVFTSYLQPGDHILIADCVYQPVRHLASKFCTQYGIKASFFDPTSGDLELKIKTRTRAIYVESPGSILYEVCDIPAIARFARAHGILLIADNTWGAGMLYSPLRLGADISIIAATKYLGGHADVMMGAVTTKEDAWQDLFTMCDTFGMNVSPDDAYLILRGMRTLSSRLSIHERNALGVAQYLSDEAEISHVSCPAMPDHPTHQLWKRDFKGTNGLVSFEFKRRDSVATAKFINSLKLFGIGASRGAFESLVTPCVMDKERSLSDWSARGDVIRLHIGLEDMGMLIEDLKAALIAYRRAR